MTTCAPTALDPRRLARIRLIFSDLDETLLGPDHQVGARSRAAVAALRERGVEVVVCTGRAPQATRPIVASLGGRYFISNNGATVYDGDRLVAEKTLPAAVVGEMSTFFFAHGCPSYLMTPAGYYVTHLTPLIEEANRVRGVAAVPLPRDQWAQPAHKVMPWGAAHLYEETLNFWGGQAHIVFHPEYLEIAPQGVNKAWGARVLAERLGVLPQAVAAVGDARNDVELITWAEVGVAMGNADPLLKEQADAIAGDYGTDGAADLFEAILAAHRRTA